MSVRVALSQRMAEGGEHSELRDCLAQDWALRLSDWGMVPIPIPNRLSDFASHFDAVRPHLLVLTGGDDLGATPERDRSERAMLAHALATDLPVLGVCRGYQLLNDYFGGRLERVQNHVASRHPVDFATGWDALYGASAEVNSFHAWAVPANGLGRELAAAAFDREGHIEACHLPGHPVAAVMWHPERPDPIAGDRTLVHTLAQGNAPWL